MFGLDLFDGDVLLGRSDFDRTEITLGSGADVALRLDDAGVGPVHARVIVRDDRPVLEPLGPVAVNDKPVRAAVTLEVGDRLSIGRFTLVVIGRSDRTATRPRPVAPAQDEAIAGTLDRFKTSRRSRPEEEPVPAPRLDRASQEALGAALKEQLAAAARSPSRRHGDSPSEKIEAPSLGPGEGRRETRRLAALVETARASGVKSLGLAFPVLITNPSLAVDLDEGALVYPLGGMRAKPAARGTAVDDELERFSVGRARDCDIVIPDQAVSKRHAWLVRRRADRWSVADGGSSNGTFLEGEKVEPAKPQEIQGTLATLRFGPIVRFAFMREASFEDYVTRLLQGPRTAAFRRQAAALAGTAPPRGPDALAATPPLGTPTKATADRVEKILAILRPIAETTPRTLVALEEAQIEEFESWPELVTFIHERGDEILTIEACPAQGRGKIVYKRDPRSESDKAKDVRFPRPDGPRASG